MIAQENPVYRFGGFELQPAERRLSRDGEPVALTPKALDTLLLLVVRAGHVVSKDELMTALWPGRFVTEANLTKHIWTLRKALGESEEGGRYIETVSKTGYRFVSRVTRVEGVPNDSASAPAATLLKFESDMSEPARGTGTIPTDTDKDRRPPRAAAAMVVLLLAAGAVVGWLQWRGTGLPDASPREPGTAVAIVDFNNLSRNPKDVWIGPAFGEMLGTDISLAGRLHTTPDELVHPARSDLPMPGAGGYAAASLALLRQRLGIDYVLSGSYLVFGSGDNPPLRLDLSLQDARSGATVATLSRTGTVADLPSLITVVGAELRKKMGAGAQTEGELRLAVNAQPPNAEVMRRMGFALDALRRYDPARARDELLQAVAQAPGYAPAYALLAKAWSSLGYMTKARAAAEQAAAHSGNLPTPLRLQIEIQRDEARFDWPHAIAGLRQLVLVQRDDPEVKLDLIDALLSAGKPAEAAKALANLQGFGGAVRGDPRIELVAARIAAAQDNSKAQIAHASRALELAKTRDAPGLIADAERQLGIAGSYNKDRKPSEVLLRRALADYRRVGNPSGEAAVHRDIGNLYLESQAPRAREEYQRSLALYQSIGDQGGIASVYSDLAILLWTAGDADGAKTAVRDTLLIRRTTGDIAGQAWALAALAIQESDDSASDAVIAGFRQAAALDADIGAHSHRGFSLAALSDILRLRGALSDAQATCAEAQAEYAKLNDPTLRFGAEFECALIARDRGDVRAAESGLRRAREAALQQGDTMGLGNADVELAQIGIGRAEWRVAAAYVASADREYTQGDMTTGETVTLGLAALCDTALGKAKERDAAIARARQLRSRITERQEVIAADIALAEVRGETGEKEQAVSQLRDIADDARKRQWEAPALDADLAAVRVLVHSGDVVHANALRASIAARARNLGFGWVLQRLQN
ncbi:MAG TPA: transcriptional regulator [Rhizomicrobium sp.]|nr:transcriptional regulator [Rhizomicrobium sp.]